MLVFPILVNAVLTVTSATNANPIVITTAVDHHYVTGEKVQISGADGNDNANGEHTITVLSSTTFSLDGVKGTGDLAPSAAPTVTQEADPDRDYIADTALFGHTHTIPRDQADLCNLMVDADQDPTGVNQELEVKLYGRPTGNSEWILVATINNVDTWETIDTWVAEEVDLRVYPEMAMAITNAFGSSTTRLRAWLII